MINSYGCARSDESRDFGTQVAMSYYSETDTPN